MNTVDLTKLASNLFKMASHRTMKIAESLYSKGLISYPRTETKVYHPSIDLKKLFERQAENDFYSGYVQKVIGRLQAPLNGTKDDKAHPPIHPCKAQSRFDDPDELKIYDLIARHFMAQISPDAQGINTHVELQFGDEFFHAEALRVTDLGFLEVYTFDTWKSGRPFPGEWQAGSLVRVSDIKFSESKTTPPLLLSEAELITKMDFHNIGTDATMHEHIKTVQEREYAIKERDLRFKPTMLGMALIQGFRAYENAQHLAKPDLRSRLESDLARIARGELQKREFLDHYVNEMKGIFLRLTDQPGILDSFIRGVRAEETAGGGSDEPETGGGGGGRGGRGRRRGRGGRVGTNHATTGRGRSATNTRRTGRPTRRTTITRVAR